MEFGCCFFGSLESADHCRVRKISGFCQLHEPYTRVDVLIDPPYLETFSSHLHLAISALGLPEGQCVNREQRAASALLHLPSSRPSELQMPERLWLHSSLMAPVKKEITESEKNQYFVTGCLSAVAGTEEVC
ncbi:hypothetical protein BaRGS_00001976 [Batillaria attramentaria]|uniref:Uncharacterized protein n=1 Tax=Batillaria attramentaria TaxID=370345 RepID=A0ABD0M3Z2_9CAEN